MMPAIATSSITQIMAAFEAANLEALAIALPATIIHEVTTANLRKWNCTGADIIGKPLLKYGSGTISARYALTEAQDSPPNIELCYSPPLAEQRSAIFRQQRWQDGAQEYMLLIGQHANAEEAAIAIQNEQRLNLALRSGGYALWDYDYVTAKTYNAPEMYDILGLPRNDPQLDFQSFNARVHPEDMDKTIERQIAKAKFGTKMFQTRYRVRMKNHDYVWIESIANLVRDPATGKPVKCVGLCCNVSDQMAALERLRNSERTLKRTQKLAKLGSFSLRVETNVSRLSVEMASLIGMEDALVHPNLATFISMIEPGDRDRFVEAMELAKLGQNITELEIGVRLPSGDIEYFQCTMEPERNARGDVETLFGSCQCVTERKGLERKFLQAQKMEAVGQLTGGVAHDFNNLLMVVIGNLQLVERLVMHDERVAKRISAAIEAADKGSDLTRRMLAFSRQQTLQNKELSPNELILRNEDMLKQAISASIELKIITTEHVWPIKADQTMLETAILNLVINARDAMKNTGGTLVIETANRRLDADYAADHEDVTPGDYVEIAVSDNGAGIAPENLEKVFQPFFTTKGPEAGSGLGLSMIYGFVKQSQGHVKIYSEVGHGTSVKLYLPRLKTGSLATPDNEHASTVQHVETQVGAPLTQAHGPRRRILIVEDNDSVRDVAAAMIEDMGFETLGAATGAEGLALIEAHHDLALVLSDVIMAGGMNGPELAARALKIRPEIKMLFMSGYTAGSARQMQDLPESIDLINKPFNRADLTDKVARALAA